MSRRTHFTAAELAEMVGRSERTILRWSAKGILPSIQIEGTRLFPAGPTLQILNGGAPGDTLASSVIEERRSA